MHSDTACELEKYVCLSVCVCAPVAQHVWGFVCVEDVRINEHLSICTARPSAIGCGEYAGPLLHLLVAGTSQPQLLRVRGSDGVSLVQRSGPRVQLAQKRQDVNACLQSAPRRIDPLVRDSGPRGRGLATCGCAVRAGMRRLALSRAPFVSVTLRLLYMYTPVYTCMYIACLDTIFKVSALRAM